MTFSVFLWILPQAIKQDVGDHKPTADRLNKTGLALCQLVSPEAASEVKVKLDEDNRRLDNVRVAVRERSNSIDIALQQSAEVDIDIDRY